LLTFSIQRYHFIPRSLIYLPNVTSLLSSLSPLKLTRGVTKITHGSIEYVNINSENTLLLIFSSCKNHQLNSKKVKYNSWIQWNWWIHAKQRTARIYELWSGVLARMSEHDPRSIETNAERKATVHNQRIKYNDSLQLHAVSWLGYGLDVRAVVVRLLATARNLQLLQSLKTDSGTHLDNYSMGTKGSFIARQLAGTWSWPLCRG